ncbi:MAG: molybdate ABC transporter substrate-binding protein [Rhizobiales bacterium]|nr:molybdate ABC transporter substrate-binding protein [Hyphomicrobiales bacterium]
MQTARRSILAVALFATLAASALAEEVKVFAAASLKSALDEIALAFEAEGSVKTVPVYAASSALAKQIEEAAPADIFISADEAWMDYLEDNRLIAKDTRINLLGNTLVLIAPKDSAKPFALQAGADLAAALGDGRLAVAEVKSVPAGKYAKAALEKLGLWDGVAGKLAMAANVRAALTLVAKGEAPLGIVYRSDAKANPGVAVIAEFPEGSHPPIVYPAARIASSTNPDAQEFLDFLSTSTSKQIFIKQGFVVP